YTAHQFIVNVWIQKRFHSYIKKIHHLSLICSFTAEIVRQLKEIIAVVNSRLHGGKLHKMMCDADLVQIVAGPALVESKITEDKRISRRHKGAVHSSGSSGKSRYLSPLSGKEHDSFVIFPHRHGGDHHALNGYQITHCLYFPFIVSEILDQKIAVTPVFFYLHP